MYSLSKCKNRCDVTYVGCVLQPSNHKMCMFCWDSVHVYSAHIQWLLAWSIQYQKWSCSSLWEGYIVFSWPHFKCRWKSKLTSLYGLWGGQSSWYLPRRRSPKVSANGVTCWHEKASLGNKTKIYIVPVKKMLSHILLVFQYKSYKAYTKFILELKVSVR